MGRASSNKRVARAARAAGRNQKSQRKSPVWPLAMVAVVGLGAALIFVSRGERAEAAAPILGDHWHAAYGVSVCGTFLPPLGDAQQDVSGIHTHQDGLMHIHPFSTRYTGDGANLAALVDQVGMTLEDDRLAVPGGGELVNGADCNGEPGLVQVKVWNGAADPGRLLEGNFGDYAPPNGSLVTIAFAPAGADLPKPPSAGTIPADVPGAGPVGGEPAAEAPTTVPTEGVTTTVPAEGAVPPEEAVPPGDPAPSTSAPEGPAPTVPQ